MTKPLQYIAVLFLFVPFFAQAQLYKSHDWEENPTFYEVSQEDKALSSVAIKEKYLIQYYNPVMGDFRLFETTHSIIRVNTDKGIERHNRVYVPMYNVRNVIDIKARVLTPDNKVKVLNKRNIKELKNVEGYGNFKIFAIEGLVKGAQLEFIYTLEKNANSLGSIVVQKNYQVNEAEVIIRKPRILKSRIKPYNGFPELRVETVEGNKEAYTGTAKRIKAMIKEGSAAPEANRVKVSYQVAPSLVSDGKMWDNLENNISAQYLNFKTKKYQRFLSRYLKATADKPKDTEVEKINAICEFVNGNFSIERSNNSDLNNLKTILSKGKATGTSINKVYSLLLQQEYIDFDMVLAANRFRHTFDEKFFSTANLQEAMIFFPQHKMYIVPGNVNTRLSPAPQAYIGTTAFFVDEMGSDFKKIQVPQMNYSGTQRDYIITINTEDEKVDVVNTQRYTGYKGKINRGAYNYFKRNDLNEFKSMMAHSGIEDARVSKFDVSNDSFNLITSNEPLHIDVAFTSESLFEAVGDDMLVLFGKVIGTQGEFYQEEERVNPVELAYPNYYQYLFEIEIPKGYTPKGLDALIIDKKVIIDGMDVCKFTSSYEVQDGKIIVKAREEYKAIHMDVSHYNAYAAVVNAAYDFSNLTILFEKQ